MPNRVDQQQVLQILQRLNGLDALKELFWGQLNYERVNQSISRSGWSEPAAKALADDPVVFAGGGEGDNFKIIVARLTSNHLPLGPQRPIITRLLRDFPYALFVFSNADRNRWHFVNVKYDATASRRQQFRRISVLPGDRLRTASERISMLDLASIGQDLLGISPIAIQQRLDEAFDVEKVTKKFFDDFVEIFAAVAKDIRKHNDWEQEVVEKETQTLLNRLLFLYFIQRKGWLNRERDYLYKRFKEHVSDDKDGTSYYSRFLHPLFMRLSTEMEEAASVLGDVPFLNGGLFDDEYGGQQRQDKLLRRTRMKVSNRAFARVFDDVLEKYNFTVREDTPLNQDVSIDPEMLGKIFESLVLQLERSDTGGKTSRHDTGSYYTPRPIVHYLCREALRVSLESKGEDRHRNIAKLLAIDASDGIDADERAVLDECLSPEQAKALRDDLENLRACDPAVGSGAFPLGLLHELVNLSRLCEARSRGRDPVEVDVDWLYNTKSRFIERVIYGVDIQERAVEICKLRLWLSLMVDLDVGVDVDNCSASAFRAALKRKVTPLPNLDYKIRRADSLIDRIHGEQVNFADIDPSDKTLPPILNRLISAKREFYTAHRLKDKRRIQFEILDAIAHLAMVEFQRAKLSHGFGFVVTKRDEEAAARQTELQRAELYMGKVRKEIAFARKGTAALQDNTLERLARELDSAEKPTFVWHLDFAEVFHRANKKDASRGEWLESANRPWAVNGFDIMVANPPYVSKNNLQKKHSAYAERLRRSFVTAQGRDFDLFGCFIERMVTLLQPDGVLSMIVAAGWYTGPGFDKLRTFVATQTDPLIFVNLPYDMFAAAWVDTTLFITRRRGEPATWPRKIATMSKLKNFNKRDRIDGAQDLEVGSVSINIADWFRDGADRFLTRSDSTVLELLRRVEKACDNLGQVADVQRGVTPFHLTERPSGKYSKPAFEGTVRRYLLERGPERFIRFDDSLAEPKPERYFTGPRILLRELISRQFQLQATYVKEDFVTNKSMQTVLALPNGRSLKFLLACINSAFMSWLFLQRSNVGHRDDFPKIVLKETRELPIPKTTPSQQAKVEALVDAIIKATKHRLPTGELDEKLDALLFSLYGLTPTEQKLIAEATAQ